MKTTEARIRKLVRHIIKESLSFDSYDKLTPEENLELRMMEHDKSHIHLENNVAIEKAFQYYSETSTMPLYRGIYEPEAQILEGVQTGDTLQLGRVTSLSENPKVAKKFATLGKMIELIPGAEGCFSLVGLIVHRFNKWEARDPRDFDMQDGDWRRNSALREAEWLLPENTIYELLEVIDVDGITVYRIKTV